jgi:hypothetical protein
MLTRHGGIAGPLVDLRQPQLQRRTEERQACFGADGRAAFTHCCEVFELARRQPLEGQGSCHAVIAQRSLVVRSAGIQRGETA